jgi:hypothetical protein
MMSRWNMLLVGGVLGLLACSGPLTGKARLETDQGLYAPGADVYLWLKNESVQTLDYNLCMARLQHHEGEEWTEVARPPNEFCPAVSYSLQSEEVVSTRRVLTETIPEGEYRYLLVVMWSGEREELVSPTFRVAKPSTP